MKKTGSFTLSPDRYFSILLTNYFERKLFTYIIFAGIGVINIFLIVSRYSMGKNILLNIAALTIIFLIPSFYLIRFYLFCHSSKNRSFFIERYIEFDDFEFV